MKKQVQDSSTYGAFLRGINVGGNRIIPMKELKKAFEELGFTDVRTLLASGNVIFTTGKKEKPEALVKKIEQKLQKTFGHSIGTQLRTIESLEIITKKNPFTEIKITPETRLYVTFIPERPKTALALPYQTAEKEYCILKETDGEVFSVLTLIHGSRSVDAMNILGKHYGKNITTRNLNTLVKMVQAARK